MVYTHQRKLITLGTRDVEAVNFLRKQKHLEERNWKRKRTLKHLTFWRAGNGSIFHKTWGRDAEAVKFLWKQRKKRKQTRKRLTLYGPGSGSKNILLLSYPYSVRLEFALFAGYTWNWKKTTVYYGKASYFQPKTFFKVRPESGLTNSALLPGQ